jgi:membrane-associated protein
MTFPTRPAGTSAGRPATLTERGTPDHGARAWQYVGGLALAVLALAVLLGAIGVPDLERLVADLSRSLGAWTYLLVGGLAFLETAALVGLVVPGETAVVAAGVVAGRGEVELLPLLALIWLAAVAGDIASFLLGRRLGRPFLEAHGVRLRLDGDRLARIESFYDRHGGKAVIAGRFVGVARAVTPFLAGASGFALRRFVPYSLAGALAWATLFTLVGYAFSGSFAEAGDLATRIALAAALLLVLLFVLTSRVRSRRLRRVHVPEQSQRAEHAEHGTREHVERDTHAHGNNRAAALLVVVNGQASGVKAPDQLLAEAGAAAAREGVSVDALVTHSETELHSVLASADQRRVVLVGGDGSLHAAANAPMRELPELALVPAGRANNIARALGIPADPADAIRVAASAAARPLDALRVETPDRCLYALEALSAGFQAEARANYTSDNSGNLGQGVRALASAVRSYAPYRVEARLDGYPLVADQAAQLFISNLPYFGFGFQINPGADPADGRFEALLLEADHRLALLGQLAAAYRGRHIGRRDVRRLTAERAELTVALPLVADSTPLGTSTASVTVERGRLHVATPNPGGRT